MAINGVSTLPTPNQPESGVQTKNNSGGNSSVSEPANSPQPAAVTAFSEDGKRFAEMKMYRAGEGPANLEASYRTLRAQHRQIYEKLSQVLTPDDFDYLEREHGLRLRRKFSELRENNVSEATPGAPPQPNPHPAPELPEALTYEDAKYLAQYRKDQYTAAIIKAGNGEHTKALAFASEAVRQAYARIPDNLTRQDLDYLAGYRLEQLQAAKTREAELEPVRKAAAADLPEELTYEDVRHLSQVRYDQYKAAYLKANENELDIDSELASSSESVRKAYAELSDETLVQADFDYLVSYRRSQYNAAKNRERELAAASAPLPANADLPDSLTRQDREYLAAYRGDQYKAALLKAGEGPVNIKDALAASSDGVRKAYAAIPDELTPQDLDYLVNYRREQYNSVRQRMADVFADTMTAGSKRPPYAPGHDRFQKLLEQLRPHN